MSLRRSTRLGNTLQIEDINKKQNIKRKQSDIKEESSVIISEKEKINYNSYFFRKDIVNEYERELNNKITLLKQNNPNLKTPMDYYKIYNLDSILEYCGTKTTYNLRSNLQNEEERKNQIEKLKLFLAREICSDIGEEYAEKAVGRAFEKKEFDIAVLATPNMEESINLIESDEISESQLTEYTQTTQYEDYNILLGKDIKEDAKDVEYKPQDYRSLSIKLRNNNLFNYRTSSIKAFIIVELGECKLYPTSFSVNLICAKKGDTNDILSANAGAFSGSGNILMGLYLYTILSHPKNISNVKNVKFPSGQASVIQSQKKIKISDKSEYIIPEETEIDIDEIIFNEPLLSVQHMAVLELAGSYRNPGGLCSYEKFGYHYEPSLYSNKCFDDYNNLPMIIDFDKDYIGDIINKKLRIINISAGDKSADFKKSLICNVRDKTKQIVLGFLKSYKIFLDKNANLDDFNVEISNKLNQLLMYINAGRNVTLSDIINYLENPSEVPNNEIEKIITNIYNNLPNYIKKGGYKKNKTKKNIKGKRHFKTSKNKSKKVKKIKSKNKTKKNK